MYNSADLLGIDSMPFLRWARIFYRNDSDRLYAPDIMLQVSKEAKEKAYTFFFYGGYPGAPEKLEAYLSERFDGINVVGKYSPPFRPLTERENDSICEMINEARPDFLWIGLGSPKQDLWIHEYKHKLKGCIIIPSGATFDFFSGRIKQAPQLIRNFGFEWLYRLIHDFRRLWVRYTIYNVIFIAVFILQLLGIVKFQEGK
jgi:N-acetylglucosaminyldiphosphoundecaprenol N-acetyl-beta-D-mannosaminyltransferase